MGASVLIKNNHETKPHSSEMYKLFLKFSNEGNLKYLKNIEIEKIKGSHSSKIKNILGYSSREEIVHKDDLVKI